MKEFYALRMKALAIAEVKCRTEPRNLYPDTQMGIDVRPEGVVFFDLVPRSYDDGEEVAEIIVSWEDIEDSGTALKRYKATIAEREKEQEAERKKWREDQYNRLKKEFGD